MLKLFQGCWKRPLEFVRHVVLICTCIHTSKNTQEIHSISAEIFGQLKVWSVILEKACSYLNSAAKQTHPSLQCSFTGVTHSISLFCVRAQVVTYYAELFSGNAAKTLRFDGLGWWLYPSRSVCFPFTESGLCMNCFFVFFSNGKLADREETFSEFDKKCIELES